jgi:ApaG protein
MTTNPEQRYCIKVSVRSDYLPEQSHAEERRYAFAYTVTIENLGTEPAQLLDRHWIITDTDGKVQEVRGEGVVGEKPYLKPGQSFRYTSGTLLETPVGSMHGSYGMVASDGTRFNAEIPPFSLATPRSLH